MNPIRKLDRLVAVACPSVVAALVSGGCVGSPPRPDLPARVEAATGLGAGAVAFHGAAEPVDAGGPVAALTVTSAVRLAVQHDPRIRVAAARVRAALSDAGQSRLLPNPVLNVAVMLPEEGGRPVINASLGADVLSLVTLPTRVSAADHRLRAASAEAVRAALDVVADVQELYASVQALDRRVAVLGERQALVNRLLDLARSRLRAGEAGRLDVITLDAGRVALEADLIERTGELRDQRLALARLVGRPGDEAAWSVTPWVPADAPVADERAWVEAALRNRPEIQARRWELAALGDDAAIAGRGFFDEASAGASAQRDPDWSVGPSASVPLPLFDWGQARRDRAEALRTEGRHELTRVRRQVVEDVRRAYAAVASARAAVDKVRDELVPLQDRRREQAEASYKAGAADVTAVLLAEQQSWEVGERLVGLQQKLVTATSQLQRAVGGPGVVPTSAVADPSTRPSGKHPGV